jgi:hypothetical protein
LRRKLKGRIKVYEAAVEVVDRTLSTSSHTWDIQQNLTSSIPWTKRIVIIIAKWTTLLFLKEWQFYGNRSTDRKSSLSTLDSIVAPALMINDAAHFLLFFSVDESKPSSLLETSSAGAASKLAWDSAMKKITYWISFHTRPLSLWERILEVLTLAHGSSKAAQYA